MTNTNTLPFLFLFLFLVLFFSLPFSYVYCEETETTKTTGKSAFRDQVNPFTAKASLIRYWKQRISSPKPPLFLLSKASPLTAVNSAKITKLAAENSLASNLYSFCSSANLFCTFESEQDINRNNNRDANFALYSSKGFQNYGGSRLGGVDAFKNYSTGVNRPNDSFKKYSRGATGHSEDFASYAKDGNVAEENFTSYGAGATGGSGRFDNYQEQVNVPTLQFTSYDSNGNNHKRSFSSYTGDTNSGSESFIGYGRNGNDGPTEFTRYGQDSNTIGSSFTGYGEGGNAANDTFKSYGDNGNNPHNDFKNYGTGTNVAIESFTSYRDDGNVGEDSFQSYAKKSNSAKVNFANYGRTFNFGNDTFKEYGKGSQGETTVGFTSYDKGRTFKDYIKNGVSFSGYQNSTSGTSINRLVEEGKFFREAMLKQGNVMAMPDIRDKMPKRSFLPRSILSKLPFSTSDLPRLKEIFHASDNSSMERVIVNALKECERAPSAGETKRCAGSVEDMIDFATSVLGRNVVVRTTQNVNGSKGKIMIGSVRGINGGKVTKSVSCHQSLYPYLLYYCHSVPKVRVYEADILDVASKEKINHGVAICHIDTSAWGPGHGAFVALGSSPGKIEVCHWIFQNDMTWAIAD